MSHTWLSIRIDLIGGGGRTFWPRPGRIFAADRRHTFLQLATGIDDAFARWDRSHLQQFELADGTRIGEPDPHWAEDHELRDGHRLTLSRMAAGEQFVYIFDLGDNWAHMGQRRRRNTDPARPRSHRPCLPYNRVGDPHSQRDALSRGAHLFCR